MCGGVPTGGRDPPPIVIGAFMSNQGRGSGSGEPLFASYKATLPAMETQHNLLTGEARSKLIKMSKTMQCERQCRGSAESVAAPVWLSTGGLGRQNTLHPTRVDEFNQCQYNTFMIFQTLCNARQ